MLESVVSAERNAVRKSMASFRARAAGLRVRLADLVRSNLFTVLLFVVVLAGIVAKLISPDALQSQDMDADGSSASVTISNRSDCVHLKFDNATAGVTTTGSSPCPGGESSSSSENRFTAISHAFQHK
jgi:hypothetical protein